MARLPFSGLDSLASPGTIAIPDNYQRIQADPGAFGGSDAKALEGFGQKLEQAGGTAMDIATQQQAFQNRGSVTDALTLAQQSAMKVQYGDPHNPTAGPGFYGLKGKQVLDRYGGAVGEVEDAYKTARDSLTNDVQKQLFDREGRRAQTSTLATMGQHHASETRTYGIASQDAAVQSNMTAAGNGYTNDRVFQEGIDSAISHQREADAMKGLPPEVSDLNAQHIISQGWQARILRTAQDSPLAAKAMLDANMGRLQADAQTKLLGHLEPLVDKAQGQNILGGITGQGNGPRGQVMTPAGPVPDMIKASASRQGIDPSDALAAAKIESGVGTASDRPGSQFRGVYQMGDAAWAARGGTAANRGDLSAQVDLGIANLVHSKKVASSALGRPAAGWEAYLIHQQGDGGGAALLKADPGQSAVAALAPAYGGNTATAARAIAGNGGQPGMTAGQFRDVWQAKFVAAGGNAGTPVQPVDNSKPYAVPTADDLLAKADAATSGMPLTVQDHVRSGVLAWRSQQEARLKGDRTGFHREYGNTVAAQADGRDVPAIDEGRIRALYPPEQAEQLVEQQRMAQSEGYVARAMQFASPADRARIIQDVSSGVGPITQTLLGRNGATAEPATDADRAQTYKLRKQALDMAVRRDAAVQQQVERDPAAYAAQSPALRDVMQAASAQGATPDQRAAAVHALMSEQERLGVPVDKRRPIAVGQISADVQALTHTDPSKADMGAALGQKAAAYGDAWPDVFGAYVKAGLPAGFQALAIMDRPDQAAGRAEFQRALSLQAEKGGLAALRESVGKAAAKEIDDGLDTKLEGFKGTVLHARDGVRMFDTFRDSVKTLAYYKSMQGNSNALGDAYEDVLGKRYDFDGTMRVPKGQMSDVKQATRQVMRTMMPADLPALESSTPGLSEQDRQLKMWNSVQNHGQWVPSPDDGGLHMIVRGNNNQIIPVTRADGKPVEVRFDRLHQFGPPAPDTAVPWVAGP